MSLKLGDYEILKTKIGDATKIAIIFIKDKSFKKGAYISFLIEKEQLKDL